jgi:BolA protein
VKLKAGSVAPLDIGMPAHYAIIVQLQFRIESKLRDLLAPLVLEVINESSEHNVPPGSESHFKVVVVSAAFAGKSLVERHRLVYEALSDEFRDGLHALSVTSRSPEEWQATATVENSPVCLGGSKR